MTSTLGFKSSSVNLLANTTILRFISEFYAYLTSRLYNYGLITSSTILDSLCSHNDNCTRSTVSVKTIVLSVILPSSISSSFPPEAPSAMSPFTAIICTSPSPPSCTACAPGSTNINNQTLNHCMSPSPPSCTVCTPGSTNINNQPLNHCMSPSPPSCTACAPGSTNINNQTLNHCMSPSPPSCTACAPGSTNRNIQT